MREIKFRCRDIVPYYDDEYKKYKMIYFDLEETKIIENLSLESIIMQYTGLKDSNGVEIYEGDILIIKDKELRSFYQWVYFKDGSFVVEEKGFADTMQLSDLLTLEPIVVGNIYDNPDLLKEVE